MGVAPSEMSCLFRPRASTPLDEEEEGASSDFPREVLHEAPAPTSMPSTTTLKITSGSGIEESTLGFGPGSTDSMGTIVGRFTGYATRTTFAVTFSTRLANRPNVVIVTNAYLDLSDFGNYCVGEWDDSSFSIIQDFSGKSSTMVTHTRPLYYYLVM